MDESFYGTYAAGNQRFCVEIAQEVSPQPQQSTVRPSFPKLRGGETKIVLCTQGASLTSLLLKDAPNNLPVPAEFRPVSRELPNTFLCQPGALGFYTTTDETEVHRGHHGGSSSQIRRSLKVPQLWSAECGNAVSAMLVGPVSGNASADWEKLLGKTQHHVPASCEAGRCSFVFVQLSTAAMATSILSYDQS